MRKYLAFLVLLIFPWVARGQALAEWYYWFDTDDAPREAGIPASRQFQITADVGHLDWGLHTLYVQVRDTAGVYSTPRGQMFFNIADNMADRLKFHYWFDNDATMTQHLLGQGNYSIDVSTLIPGFHIINYYVTDEKGTMSDIESVGFFRSPVTSNQKLNYWFEGDTLATQIPHTADGLIIDVTRMQEGFNTIYFQMYDNGPAGMEACHFIKIPQTEGVGDMTLLCVIDGKIASEEQVSAQGGVVTCNMDVTHMEVGLHKAMFQLITQSGASSSIAETYFIRTLTNDDIASMQCSYLIDGFDQHTQKGTCTNGAFHFDLPVNEIEDGLHRIDFMLMAENGATTTQGTAWFFKTPLGGNAITQYDYWLNGKNDDVHSVKLDEPTDPFQLIKLLPVTAEPIRSTCFHFESKDGQPKIYAKNDIHFRFHDRSGRWVDADNQYVDYNVGENVNDITELQDTQTFDRPDSNRIKWFRFEASYGDSIALKSNQATSIQIFDTSGQELYSASGSTSVNYGGCHLFDDGTYYVAVHDVTGSNGKVTLDIKRIDKYAVLEYTPNKMSGVGKTLMYFKGNGLDQVKSIELYNDEMTLSPDTIIATATDMLARFTSVEQLTTSAKASLKVFFNNTDKGDSKTLIIEDAVTLEPVNEGKITVDIVTELRVGDPYPIRVTLKNQGNVGSYGIPVNIAFDNVNILDEFVFVNFDILMSENLCQSKEFFSYTDNLCGKGVSGFFMPLLIPYLGPYEELTLVFGVKTKNAHARFNFYAWAGEPWYAPCWVYTEYSASRAKNGLAFATQSGSCEGDSNLPKPHDFHLNSSVDYSDPSDRPDQPYDPGMLYEPGNIIDDLTDMPIGPGQTLRPWLGVGEAIGGISQGMTRARDDAVLEAYGLDPSDPANDQYRYHYRTPARSPLDIWNDANPFQAPLRRGPLTANAASSEVGSADDYANKPCPDPEPHPTDVYIPGDPNEITGYLSESGSLYINDNVVHVGYDIEFENDPEIANASAHKIIIRDTLDARFFDFDSFEPKTVKISGKEVELDGSYPFVKTYDMRPEIYAIAELSGDFDKTKGIATWNLTSLDPMTMEPTDDIMQGILPVNSQNGNGIGNVTFTINLKTGLADGMEIPNRAGIVFDHNDIIVTPTWTNIVDTIAPTSVVSELIVRNDSICDLSFEGEDNRSGIWKYTLYVQDGLSAPWREMATDIAPDSIYSFKGFDCVNYGFCVLATDSAGNVERKELTAEAVKMTMRPGDVNVDGDINVIDFTAIANHIMGSTPASFVVKAADVNEDDEINVMDLTGVANLILFGEVSPNRAQANNRIRRVSDQLMLHVSDCEVMAGEEFTVDIHMDGDADFSAFQFDMTLPESLHVKLVDGAPCATLNTERTTSADTDFFVSRLSNNGTLRVLVASTRDFCFEGNEGCVARVTLVADEKASAGDYEVAVSHIVTANGGTGLSLNSTKFVVTVGASTDINSLIDGTHGPSLYDMVGKKIRRDHERTGLEKGTYIKNGKKIIVK